VTESQVLTAGLANEIPPHNKQPAIYLLRD
jgi:hypothetical protein